MQFFNGWLRRSFFVVATAALLGAAEPSSRYNAPGEHRTATCAAMKTAKVALLFPDGTPTGFFASADDPSERAGRHACPPGSIELDDQETITTAEGKILYFHPGGGGKLYRDAVNNGQYGHVAIEQLKDPPKTKPQEINGKPAPPAADDTYVITPTRIPDDMYYKPNVVNGSSGSSYRTYGNPGADKTKGHGDYTYICWSWVQNGGAEYPANVNHGGGMVRALGKRGTLFQACDVEPIVGYSYGKDNKVNGRVTAIYGQIYAGPGEKGSKIYGWIVKSYQRTGGQVVPCLEKVTKQRSRATEAKPEK